MKVAIEVESKNEGELIKRALTDPVVRAFVVVCASLMSLPSDRARERTLQYVRDALDERREQHAAIIGGADPDYETVDS